MRPSLYSAVICINVHSSLLDIVLPLSYGFVLQRVSTVIRTHCQDDCGRRTCCLVMLCVAEKGKGTQLLRWKTMTVSFKSTYIISNLQSALTNYILYVNKKHHVSITQKLVEGYYDRIMMPSVRYMLLFGCELFPIGSCVWPFGIHWQ